MITASVNNATTIDSPVLEGFITKPMRIVIKTSPNTQVVPFDYQRTLVGTFHKWLGKNLLHDEISLYSLSWLQKAKKGKKGLDFKKGGEWHISAHDPSIIENLIRGIQDKPEISYGMEVTSITVINTPKYKPMEKFYLNSPVFVKRNENGRARFYLFHDQETNLLMSQTMVTKLRKANLNCEGLKIYFDREYKNPKTKKITFGGIDCRASICPIIIEGTPEQIAFAWNVGVGNNTGIGFGALK